MVRKMKLFKDNRGLSEIISALLMIVITIFAFSTAYMATNTWISTQRSGPMLALQERLVIEDVWFKTNATGKFISVYSRNIGLIEVEIYSLRVDGVTPSGIAPNRLTLPIRFGGWMNASLGCEVGKTYKIELLTNRGGVVTTYATA